MACDYGRCGRWLTGLGVTLALIGFAGSAQAEQPLLVLAKSELIGGPVFDGVPVSDDVLARMQGKGAEGPDISFTDVTGVVLWDEVGGPKGGGTPSSASSGVGNAQSNSLLRQ